MQTTSTTQLKHHAAQGARGSEGLLSHAPLRPRLSACLLVLVVLVVVQVLVLVLVVVLVVVCFCEVCLC